MQSPRLFPLILTGDLAAHHWALARELRATLGELRAGGVSHQGKLAAVAALSARGHPPKSG